MAENIGVSTEIPTTKPEKVFTLPALKKLDSDMQKTIGAHLPTITEQKLEDFTPMLITLSKEMKRIEHEQENNQSFEEMAAEVESGTRVKGNLSNRQFTMAEHKNNKINPDTTISLAEAKQYSGLARDILSISSLFGQKIHKKVERMIENRANKELTKQTIKVIQSIKIIETIDNPKDEFLTETLNLYEELNQRQENNFGIESPFDVRLTYTLNTILNHRKAESYPLIHALTNVLPIYGDQIETLGYIVDTKNIGIVEPEILKNIEGFLRNKGKNPTPHRLTSGFKREIAEIFKQEELQKGQQQIQQSIPTLLEDVYDLLPNNGPAFAQVLRAKITQLANLDKKAKPQEVAKILGLQQA